VRAAFVVGLPDERRGEIVAAVVVPHDGATLDGDDLRTRLRSELSAYKVPTRWLVTDDESIPRLASGKPDKRTLRERLLRG
jgi:acyl-CoA synthetase (AMP-forming)/AMP-acid ligase II